MRRDRRVGVVVDLGALDDRHPLVEQVDQRADHAGLRLAALAQEDHVVTGQEGVLQLGEHGVLVAEHLGEQLLTGPDPGRGVAADLGLHRDRLPAGGPQLAERGRQVVGGVGIVGCDMAAGYPCVPTRTCSRSGRRPRRSAGDGRTGDPAACSAAVAAAGGVAARRADGVPGQPRRGWSREHARPDQTRCVDRSASRGARAPQARRRPHAGSRPTGCTLDVGRAQEHAALRLHVVVGAPVADRHVALAHHLAVGRVERQPAPPRDRRFEPGVGLHDHGVAHRHRSPPSSSSVNR